MLLDAFPQLADAGYTVTSPPSAQYNCFAWAAGDHTRRWEPDSLGSQYWPEAVPREYTLAAFTKMFESLGYEVCPSGEPEPGFEKVAIYTRFHVPQHAAKQLPSGQWSSKLGDHKDISHALYGLEGEIYGAVERVMRRPLGGREGRIDAA
jgi:hypothetical protein